jgi:hypothetical protein
MARNRRRRPRIHRVHAWVRRLGLAIVCLVSVAVAYIWMGIKCTKYGEEIRRLEIQSAEQDNERVREEFKWNAMKSAEQLDGILLRHGLQMDYPSAGQVIRLPASLGGVG